MQELTTPQRVTTTSLASIGSEFESTHRGLSNPEAFTRDMAHLALACLYICAEREDTPNALDAAILMRCIKALDVPLVFAWKALPFVLGLSLLGATDESPSQLLASHLTNGSSQVRAYAFAMGWLIRRHLNAAEVVQPLLSNVESTMGYWDESLALCRGLYATNEDFWAAIENYVPVAMPEQFAHRLGEVRKHMQLIVLPASLLESEVLVQRLVIQHAFRTHSD